MVAVVIHVRYNIRYGRIGAADSDVEEAASAADMHSRILTFPNGKNTCYIAGNVFPIARSGWLLRGHMTSNNETVSRQNHSGGDLKQQRGA